MEPTIKSNTDITRMCEGGILFSPIEVEILTDNGFGRVGGTHGYELRHVWSRCGSDTCHAIKNGDRLFTLVFSNNNDDEVYIFGPENRTLEGFLDEYIVFD